MSLQKLEAWTPGGLGAASHSHGVCVCVSVYGIQSEIASLQLKKLGKPSAYFPPQIINYLKSN